MRITTMRALAIISLVLTSALVTVRAQENETVSDKDIKVTKFVELAYRPVARAAHIEGLVVIRVKLDDRGNVTDATAISGADLLVPECVANVKKWKFQPNPHKTAVIVYEFTQPPALCGSVDSIFLFEGVNHAKVMACPLTVQTAR